MRIQDAPSSMGVYLFKKKGRVIYVGKSLNIKARLASHLENAKVDRKERAIIENYDSIEYISTDSEFKALVLESRLIQTHRPKYNVRWRDNKSYLYIKITAEDFPKVLIARKENDGKSTYFGPFPSRRSVVKILREIRKIAPFCTQAKIYSAACFYSKIGLCDPCPSQILKTKDDKEVTFQKRLYRTNIRQVMKILRGDLESVQKQIKNQIEREIRLEDFEKAITFRNKLLEIEKLIHQRLFDENNISHYDQKDKALEELIQIVAQYSHSLQKIHRIECYDASNYAQKDATASMVVMIDGEMRRDLYKRFKIKNKALKSDQLMLREALRRRFGNNWETPDLIVVDGGKPQVRIVRSVLSERDMQIAVIGIAKNPDRLIIGAESLSTYRPRITNLGFSLLRLLRDESHRFAKKYHTYLRNKKLGIIS